ncbi:hypothetical protein Y033_5776 [Burkholderia pseudomallei MSHR435]|nr:hypothetical protein DO70_4463 [Burkholderia pseudomallei]KGS21242.1 hypothetical protein X941_5611 [Burkholderia pseudomallei MSHR5569]KGS79747.1 hypothetical protein X947_4279 [Burkholderia pseudomallei MSHR7334]KGX57001.1 hypothetical protein Y024_4442 [Burkholderia pseudomallei TSV44]KGX79450.1 hypothetical protein Y033_5776 [Burkholderia pseudomallei MSHR435]
MFQRVSRIRELDLLDIAEQAFLDAVAIVFVRRGRVLVHVGDQHFFELVREQEFGQVPTCCIRLRTVDRDLELFHHLALAERLQELRRRSVHFLRQRDRAASGGGGRQAFLEPGGHVVVVLEGEDVDFPVMTFLNDGAFDFPLGFSFDLEIYSGQHGALLFA